MVLTCFSPVSFFDVFHVTCFIISLSGQYFNQLSPSRGSSHCPKAALQCWVNSPPQGWEGLLTYKFKNICAFFFLCVCVLLCVRCWNSHVVRKMAAIPNLGALVWSFVCFGWRVQALLAWSGAHGSLDQGTGVLILHVVCHHGSAQQNTSCDKWHKTCINLLDGWCCGVLSIL